jgi:hypothetical protein
VAVTERKALWQVYGNVLVLLYVAMTRARDLLRVTWTGKPSPFLSPVLPAIGGTS